MLFVNILIKKRLHHVNFIQQKKSINIYKKRLHKSFHNIHLNAISMLLSLAIGQRCSRLSSMRNLIVNYSDDIFSWLKSHWRVIIYFLSNLVSASSSYDDSSLKSSPSSSVIIPTPVLERDADKYSHSINHLSMSNHSTAIAINTALKIEEEVSNETSNLMIEDRQNSTGSTIAASRYLIICELDWTILRAFYLFQFIGSIDNKFWAKWQQ